MKNEKSISDLDGFCDICNETELFAANAGCDTSWLNSQYEHTNGDYVNQQVSDFEKLREEASSFYGKNRSGNYPKQGVIISSSGK